MKGYRVEGDRIIFELEGHEEADEVYVVGNFLGWELKEEWKMESSDGGWMLEVDKGELGEGFKEFTFVVDGEWLDADQGAENVNHCPGYGYRYTIE